MVLPSDQPVGLLLPDVLRLIDDRAEAPPQLRQLVTADGTVLRGDTTLTAARVPDGAILTVARVEDAPPAPVVHDVSEEVADDLRGRSWRWDAGPRRWTATVAALVATAAAGLLTREAFADDTAAVVLMAVAAALAILGGSIARAAHEPLGVALTLGGAVVGVTGGWSAAEAYDWPGWARWGFLTATAAAVVAVLGLTSSLGRGGLIGGGAGLVLAGLWTTGAAAGLPSTRVAACMSVVVVGLLGILPRIALVTSGLATLDDRRSAGSPVARHDVRDALAAAHRGLVLATVAVAAAGAAAGLVLGRSVSGWTVPLSLLLAVVLLSRARTYPLALQVIALQAAAVAVLLALPLAWSFRTAEPPYGPLAAVAVGALLPLAALAFEPSEHVRVRLRRLADRLEAVAVIATIPVAIGVFGTYDRLLHVFT
jgi:type VII secretion integral membrane protein EccD